MWRLLLPHRMALRLTSRSRRRQKVLLCRTKRARKASSRSSACLAHATSPRLHLRQRLRMCAPGPLCTLASGPSSESIATWQAFPNVLSADERKVLIEAMKANKMTNFGAAFARATDSWDAVRASHPILAERSDKELYDAYMDQTTFKGFGSLFGGGGGN